MADTKEKAIRKYRESSQIGSPQLLQMSEYVLSAWYDMKTPGGLAIYKLNTQFMRKHIPDAELIKEAIEGLEICLQRHVRQTDNPPFEKKQLQNTISNLELLAAEAEEESGNKEASVKEALFGLSKEEKFLKKIKKEFDPILKRLGVSAKYSPQRVILTSSKNSSKLDVFFNFKSGTWEISYNLSFPDKKDDYVEKYQGKLDLASNDFEGSRHIHRFLDQYSITLSKKAGVQDFVDTFNAKFIKGVPEKSFKAAFGETLKNLGLVLKYKSKVQKGKYLGFDAYFEGKLRGFTKVSILYTIDTENKKWELEYSLQPRTPLSKPGDKNPTVKEKPKALYGNRKGTLDSSDFVKSNKSTRRHLQALFTLLANPNFKGHEL